MYIYYMVFPQFSCNINNHSKKSKVLSAKALSGPHIKNKVVLYYHLNQNCNFEISSTTYLKCNKEYKTSTNKAKKQHNIRIDEFSKNKCKQAWKVINLLQTLIEHVPVSQDGFNKFQSVQDNLILNYKTR